MTYGGIFKLKTPAGNGRIVAFTETLSRAGCGVEVSSADQSVHYTLPPDGTRRVAFHGLLYGIMLGYADLIEQHWIQDQSGTHHGHSSRRHHPRQRL